jgi:hypothetical protein
MKSDRWGWISRVLSAMGSTVMILDLREKGDPEAPHVARISLFRCPDYGCLLQREAPGRAVLISVTTARPRLSSYHSHYSGLPPRPPPLSSSRYSRPGRQHPALPSPRSAYFVTSDPSSSRPASSSRLHGLASGRKGICATCCFQDHVKSRQKLLVQSQKEINNDMSVTNTSRTVE